MVVFEAHFVQAVYKWHPDNDQKIKGDYFEVHPNHSEWAIRYQCSTFLVNLACNVLLVP